MTRCNVRAFRNEHNACSKMSVRRTLDSLCSSLLAVIFTFADERYIWSSLSFWCHLVYIILFPRDSSRSCSYIAKSLLTILCSIFLFVPWSHNVTRTPCLSRMRTHNVSVNRHWLHNLLCFQFILDILLWKDIMAYNHNIHITHQMWKRGKTQLLRQLFQLDMLPRKH
jgi:hypothetical protein